MSIPNRPWLDSTLPETKRIQLLLNEMTPEEKIAQMVQISYSVVPEKTADEWAFRGAGSFLHVLGDNARRLQRLATQNRLGIPVIFGIDAIHGHGLHNGATVYPTQLALACSWNEDLAYRVARATAKEVAAEGLHWTFSPVFCLGRDLRWGRINETFGEDKLLAGRLGAAMVRGYQGTDTRNPDSIIACAKHYIAYGESTGGRDSYDAPVSLRNVRTNFLPPFIEAVKAGCLTFMAGYNPVDGVPCSANETLLRDILKNELGFDGFVVTDWMNTTSLMSRQKMAAHMKDASRIALESGNDMIMTSPEFYESMLALVRDGKADIAQIEDAVTRILAVKFRAGLFDVPEKILTLPTAEDPQAEKARAVFACSEHRALALDAARDSIVLLKNEDLSGVPALPLRTGNDAAGKSVKRIAVIGPNADSVRAQFGDWTFFTHPVPALDSIPELRVTTLLEGVRDIAGHFGVEVLWHKGCDILDPAKEQIAEACEIAARADAIIVCVGDTLILNGETHDRSDLALTGAQDRLVESLSKVASVRKIPLTAVLINGKPLEFERVACASNAVIEAFNPGIYGGQAIAEIIFGLSEPRGRLPISFPRKTGQLPVYYNQLPGWHDGAYCDCPRDPLFAFGEGLGWTTFSYETPKLSASRASAGDTVTVTVSVTNTGSLDGTETVQLYAADRIASVVTPVRELKGFKRVFIPAGQTATVEITLETDALSLVDRNGKTVLEPGEFDILVGHDSRIGNLKSTILEIV